MTATHDTWIDSDDIEAVASAFYESLFVTEFPGEDWVEAARYRQAARAAIIQLTTRNIDQRIRTQAGLYCLTHKTALANGYSSALTAIGRAQAVTPVLERFASLADRLPSNARDHDMAREWQCNPLVGDLRAAKAALGNSRTAENPLRAVCTRPDLCFQYGEAGVCPPCDAKLSGGVESAWLVEGWSSGSGQLKAEWYVGGFEDVWSKDSLQALRFARECDAQKVIDDNGWTEARATEHTWETPIEP